MPLKLTVGVSRKEGRPGFGSAGALCHLEFELEVGLLESDPAGFRAWVRAAYDIARGAVEEELARAEAGVGPDSTERPGLRPRRPATPAQARALAALARRRGEDLQGLVHAEFGLD